MILLTHCMLGNFTCFLRERCGSMVECFTRDQGVVGSSLTGVTALSLCTDTFSLLSTGSTQEDPSRHNWKIVDLTFRIKSNKTCLCCHLLTFSNLTFSKVSSTKHYQCQTVWIQIRTNWSDSKMFAKVINGAANMLKNKLKTLLKTH